MRRIGLWIALSVLLAAGWFVANWLRVPAGEPRVGGPRRDMPSRLTPSDSDRSGLEVAAVQDQRTEAEFEETAVDLVQDTSSDGGIRLRVVDPADAPIAGARVTLPDRPTVPERFTDADGRCSLPGGLDTARGLIVAVAAQGFFPLRQQLFQTEEEIELRLCPPALLSGRVLESDTRLPIRGARVTVAWNADDGESRAVLTDAGGWFAEVQVPAGLPFHLRASAAGFLDRERWGNKLIVSPDESDPSTELLLDHALVGEFLILDSESGEPVAGAVVWSGSTQYASDDRGRVSIDRSLRTSDASYTLSVRAAAHCSTMFEVQELGSPDDPVELRLPRACSIVGTLRDAQGVPMSDVTVAARIAPEIGEELRRTGRLPASADAAKWPENATWVRSNLRDRVEVSDQGRFELDGLPPGLARVEMVVAVERRELARREVGPIGPPGSRLQVDWQLEPVDIGELRGRLLLNGEPHAGAVACMQAGREGYVTVGSDGAYSFDDLAPGEVELTGSLFSADTRLGRNGHAIESVVVVEGQVTQVDLDVRMAMSTISGTLSDFHGAPLAGVQISFWNPADHSTFSGVSEDDGAWSIRVADVPEEYRIQCRRPLREEGLEVRAGTKDLALHELASGRLRYRALDAATGERISAVQLALRGADGEQRTIGSSAGNAPDTTGWAEVDLPEGNHQLGAWSIDRAYLGVTRDVHIAPDSVSEVEFRLERSEAVTMRLVPNAQPLPDGHVALLLTDTEWELVTADFDEGRPKVSFAALPFEPGRYRELFLRPERSQILRGLAPGRYRFKVFPDDVRIEPEWIDVPAEGVVEVRWAAKP
jgi:hypothetical protein